MCEQQGHTGGWMNNGRTVCGGGIQSGLTLYSTKILYTDLTVITLITEYQLQELYLKECQTALHYLVCWIWSCKCDLQGAIQRESLEGENFCEFQVVCKSFLHKIWGCGILWQYRQAIHESFLCKNCIFFNNSLKFSPLKVFRYTVAVCSHLLCCQEASLWLLSAGMLLRIHSSHSTVDFNSLRT